MEKLDTKKALEHFREFDPLMARMLEAAIKAKPAIELPTPGQSKKFFENITRSIVGQQISTKAAAAVYTRFKDCVGEVTPERVLAVPPEALRTSGLSGQKTKYILHNAKVWPTVPVKEFKKMSDEEVIEEMTKLYGIGRWTAEMFLMFSLARPNVFSYGDLGLMQSLYEHYEFKPHWKRKIENTVNAWAPHKTTASLTLWFHKDNGPLGL